MTLPTVHFDAAAREMLQRGGIRGSDLHVHSSRSDALTRPDELVRIARERGIQIAVADHNVIGGALEAWEAAVARGDAAIQVDGGMVDEPVARRARALLGAD